MTSLFYKGSSSKVKKCCFMTLNFTFFLENLGQGGMALVNLACKHLSDIDKCELQGSEKVSLTCVQGNKAPIGIVDKFKIPLFLNLKSQIAMTLLETSNG
ncbi:hypothetical protein AAG906_017507 [Vitis piasezkii]